MNHTKNLSAKCARNVVYAVKTSYGDEEMLFLIGMASPGAMTPEQIRIFLESVYESGSSVRNSTEYADFHRACRVALSWTHNFAPEEVDEFLAGLEPFPEDQE